jgi:hypothetical protein
VWAASAAFIGIFSDGQHQRRLTTQPAASGDGAPAAPATARPPAKATSTSSGSQP